MPSVKSVDVLSDTYYDSVRAILHSTLEAVQAKYGVVSLTSTENGGLRNYISYGLLSRQRTGISAARWVVAHGEPLALEDREQALLVPDLAISKSESLPLICVPIQVRGTTLGAFQSSFLSATGHEELLRKQHFLRLAADLMGYIIENATLRRRLQETEELLRNVSNIGLDIQERERERLILEVHDGVAQTLASAFTYLQVIDDMGGFREEDAKQYFVKAVSLIRKAIRETRAVLSSVTPAILETHGLVPTLQRELKQFGRETECKVNLHSATWPNLPRHTEFTIYRIISEAITNVRKHAKSPRLEVGLSQEQKRLTIRVKDWGIGFIPVKQELTSSNHCIGLISMRRRTELLGGTFAVNSSLGKGTEILVDIPWSADEE
jgi:signal transduction histidine kinase